MTRHADENTGGGGRTSVYCLVPAALADELLAPLRAHYRCDPDVKVIVDRRQDERPLEQQANRRRPVVPRELTASLPPELAARASDLRWEQRLRPVRRRLQNHPLPALLRLIRDGDDDAHTELYWRYGNRVRALLGTGLGGRGELDAATRQTFGRIFDQVARTDPGSRSFDVYLASVTDAVARDRSRRGGMFQSTA